MAPGLVGVVLLSSVARGQDAQDDAGAPAALTASNTREPASAPTPASVDASQALDRLETLLRTYEEKERTYRFWSGVSLLAAGAVTVPAGIVISRRGTEPSLLGPFVIGLGAVELTGGLLTFLPSPNFGKLTRELEEQRASGKTPEETLARLEARWKELAEEWRSSRRFVGALLLGLGALNTGLTATLAFMGPSDSQNEATLYWLGFGVGLFGMLEGLKMLFLEHEIEATWNAYRLTTPPRPQLGVGYAPAPGGGTFQLIGTF
jgi:hypothetical protein